jgi:hypothetical protein
VDVVSIVDVSEGKEPSSSGLKYVDWTSFCVRIHTSALKNEAAATSETSETLPIYAQCKHPGAELTSLVDHHESLEPVIYHPERIFPVHRILESSQKLRAWSQVGYDLAAVL